MAQKEQENSCRRERELIFSARFLTRRLKVFICRMYTSVVSTLASVLAVGNDRALRELTLPDVNPSKMHDAGLVLTNLAVSTGKGVLFASTLEYGKPSYVRMYPYPLTGEYDDYPCFESQIVRMRFTADELFLIVVDEQGCVILMELKGKQDRFQRGNPSAYMELSSSPDWGDEVLVTRAELDELDTNSAELATKVSTNSFCIVETCFSQLQFFFCRWKS